MSTEDTCSFLEEAMSHLLQPKARSVCGLPVPAMELWMAEVKVTGGISQASLNPRLQRAPLVPPAPRDVPQLRTSAGVDGSVQSYLPRG